MELKRGPFEGVMNIIRFNWHFYVLTGVLCSVLFWAGLAFSGVLSLLVWMSGLIIMGITVISLLVSFYIYDRSPLYRLPWLAERSPIKLLNVHAGFDEVTPTLKHKFPDTEVVIADFYDPQKHTEVSVKRARKAFPPHRDTVKTESQHLPFKAGDFDMICVMMSAHEIRDEQERIGFFEELKRVSAQGGRVYVTEHLRDLNNFLAYNIGFLHFHSRGSWMKVFEQAGFQVREEVKTTSFISTFILEKDGNTF